MVKRSLDLQVLPSPGLKDAPVLDLMCSHFVLTLAAKQGGKFNVRRDLNGLLSLAGRHLVWPAPALARRYDQSTESGLRHRRATQPRKQRASRVLSLSGCAAWITKGDHLRRGAAARGQIPARRTGIDVRAGAR